MKTRIWMIGTGLICIIVLLVGVLGGLLPQLTDAAATGRLVMDARAQNETFQGQLDALKADESNAEELNRDLEALREAIPSDAASERFARELAELEAATGGQVAELRVQTPLRPGPVAAAAESGETSTEDGTATTAVSGVQGIPLGMVVTGESRDQVADFVRGLQVGSRLITIELVRIEATGSGWRGDIQGAIYAYPGE